MDHDHFIVKPTHHDNDLDEWEMEETGESTRNIFDVLLNDEEVELFCIDILLKES